MTVPEQIRKRVLEDSSLIGSVENTPIIYEEPEPMPRNNFLGKFLGSSVIVMSISILFLLISKNCAAKPISKPVAQTFSQPAAKSDMQIIMARFDKLEREFKDCNRRVWLLGVAHNENVAVAKQYGVCSPQSLVYFDDQWKLNRMPQSMTMTDLQKFEIQACIK